MKKFLIAVAVIVVVFIGFGVYRQNTSVKNVVVIYTPHHSDFMENLNKLFEAKYPDITVQLVRGNTTQMEERIRSEKTNPMGDVMFGGDVNTYIQLKKSGLLQPMTLSVADKLPFEMKDSENYWFAPYRVTGIFFYNNTLVTPEQAPKDWDELLKPEWKGSVTMLNPTQSGTARTFCISLIKVWGKEKAFEFLQKLNDQLEGQYVASQDKLFAALTRGEAKVSLWHEADILKMKYKKNMPFNIVYPASGTYINPEPIAVIAGAPHKEAAQKYVEFIFEVPSLELTAGTYMNRPTRTDFPKDKLPDYLQNDPKAFSIDWASIGEQGKKWLQEWSEEIWHKKST
jgi:iron(III) transport system substrate-binding protein